MKAMHLMRPDNNRTQPSTECGIKVWFGTGTDCFSDTGFAFKVTRDRKTATCKKCLRITNSEPRQ